jgi:hypothetical protein
MSEKNKLRRRIAGLECTIGHIEDIVSYYLGDGECVIEAVQRMADRAMELEVQLKNQDLQLHEIEEQLSIMTHERDTLKRVNEMPDTAMQMIVAEKDARIRELAAACEAKDAALREAMRFLLTTNNTLFDVGHSDNCAVTLIQKGLDIARAALSPDAGKGWLSPKEAQKLREENERLRTDPNRCSACDQRHCHEITGDMQKKIGRLRAALVEAESKAAPEQPRKAPVNDKEPSTTEDSSTHNNGELLGAANLARTSDPEDTQRDACGSATAAGQTTRVTAKDWQALDAAKKQVDASRALRARLGWKYDELEKNNRPPNPEAQKALHKNRWELYSTAAPPIDSEDEATLDRLIAERQSKMAIGKARMAERQRLLDNEFEEVDLDTCPTCGGPADNGNDRCIPPSPYICTKCERENER